MAMIEEMEKSGRWLFRWRSYLPLLMIVFLILGIQSFVYPFGSHLFDQIWEIICFFISMVGLTIRSITIGFAPKGTSGRNVRQQVATTLNTTGMYSIVRNPLYLGNFFATLGIALFLRIWWCPVIYALLFMLYYERIIFTEEMFLRQKFGEAYLDWASKTPIFFPKLRLWKKPELSFNFRKVCRKEYQTLFGIVSTFYCLELASEYKVGEPLFEDMMWNIIASLVFLIYLTVRILKKFSSIFKDTKDENKKDEIATDDKTKDSDECR